MWCRAHKVDRVPPGVRRSAMALLRALNPDAQIIETQFGRIPPQIRLSSTHSFAAHARPASGALGRGALRFWLQLHRRTRNFEPLVLRAAAVSS